MRKMSMKKAFVGIIAGIICCLILPGCAQKAKDADTAENVADVQVSSDGNGEKENEENDSVSIPAKKPDLGSQKGIRAYLAGDWALYDRKKDDDFGTLSIQSDGRFEFTRLSDGAKGNGKLIFENSLSKEGEAPDGFRMEFDDCRKLVPEGVDLYGDEGTSGIFHIGTFGNEDDLYLKEIGNGDSVVSMYIFNTDGKTDGNWSYDWLFYRENNEKSTATPVKNDTFYAWAWEVDDNGDGVWLQQMTEHEYETYEDYSNRKFLGGYFTEKEDIGIAYYSLKDDPDLSGLVNTAAWNSGYPLMMCEVTTDDNGNIKKLRDVDVAMYNVYDMGEFEPEFSYEGTVFTINGSDIDMRDYVPGTERIIDCMRAGDWIIVECFASPYKSVYEFYNIPNGDMGYFEYEITGSQLTWRGDDLATAVYACDNGIYDFWGNQIGYVEEGVIGRIDITDDTTVSAHISVTDDIGNLKEYVKDFEYEPCDVAMLLYYEYLLGGPRQLRRLTEKAGDATVLIMVDPPEKILERMPQPIEYERGALDKVVVVPLADDAKVTIKPIQPGGLSDERTEEVAKGRAVVFAVTVSEGMPSYNIIVKEGGRSDVVWEVMQLSGRIPQMSDLLK